MTAAMADQARFLTILTIVAMATTRRLGTSPTHTSASTAIHAVADIRWPFQSPVSRVAEDKEGRFRVTGRPFGSLADGHALPLNFNGL